MPILSTHKQARYCSAECQRAHWKTGDHKAFCKAMKAVGSLLAATGKDVAAAAAVRGSVEGGACIICFEKDPQPLQSGCGCRGDAGLAHIGCRATDAEHAVRSRRSNCEIAWGFCRTCGQQFTGTMLLGLALKRWCHAQRLPKEDRERVDAAKRLGDALITVHKLTEAEVVFRCTVAMAKRACGDDDAVVFGASLSLSTVLLGLEKHAESEAINKHCYAECLRLFGADHSTTIAFAASLAVTLTARGAHKGAHAIYQANLASQKRVLSNESGVVLTSVIEVANALFNMRKLDEAEALYMEYLPIARRVLGPEHTVTLTLTSDRAMCAVKSGRLAEGEALLAETLASYKRVLGIEHPYTLLVEKNLADVRRSIARSKKNKKK
jgi:hypothetical protein